MSINISHAMRNLFFYLVIMFNPIVNRMIEYEKTKEWLNYASIVTTNILFAMFSVAIGKTTEMWDNLTAVCYTELIGFIGCYIASKCVRYWRFTD